MRNMPGTGPLLLLLLLGQPVSALKLLRRLGQMVVGEVMDTCMQERHMHAGTWHGTQHDACCLVRVTACQLRWPTLLPLVTQTRVEA